MIQAARLNYLADSSDICSMTPTGIMTRSMTRSMIHKCIMTRVMVVRNNKIGLNIIFRSYLIYNVYTCIYQFSALLKTTNSLKLENFEGTLKPLGYK